MTGWIERQSAGAFPADHFKEAEGISRGDPKRAGETLPGAFIGQKA